jgi:hypothetical protein
VLEVVQKEVEQECRSKQRCLDDDADCGALDEKQAYNEQGGAK